MVTERWHFATKVDTSLIGAGGTEVASSRELENPDEGDGPEVTGLDGDDPGAVGGEIVAPPGELDVPGILGGRAQELAQPTATVGVATTRGTEVLSTRWVLPWIPTPTPDSTVVIVTSPQEANIEVHVLVNGELQGPLRASIAAGGRAIIPLAVASSGAPVIVTSDAPISVEAQIVVLDGYLATVPGIPTVIQ